VFEFLEARPFDHVRHAAEARDLVDLVQLALALQRRLAQQHLAKDATNRPHIDRCAVELGAKEQLGRAIPQRHDDRRVIAERVAVRPSETKVGNLQDALVVHQNVGRFEVAVDDPVLMEILHAEQQLLQDTLDLGSREGLSHILQNIFEVVFNVLHHDEHIIRLRSNHHLANANDVNVLTKHQQSNFAN